MPLDPAAGFALDPDAATRERIRALERELAAFRGAVAASDFEAAIVQTGSAALVDLGGPSVDVLVPQGGAFVTLYAELEVRINSGTEAPRATIHEPTDFPAGSAAYLRAVAAAGVFTLVRQTAAPGGIVGAPGLVVAYMATPGLRTYSLRYQHDGGAGGDVSFRNRRLVVRVAQ